MLEAVQSLFVANGAINPWFAFVIGTIAGTTLATGYFRCFYTPGLEGAVSHNAARKESIYQINRFVCALRDAAQETDQEKRRKKVDDCFFLLLVTAEIQPIIPFAFVRKRVKKYAARAEQAAINGKLPVIEKFIAKIIANIA